MSMAVLSILVAAVLATVGWFFLFRTNVIVRMNRRLLDQNGSWSKLPYAGWAEKRWFPFFLRCQGILSWFAALGLLVLAASAGRAR